MTRPFLSPRSQRRVASIYRTSDGVSVWLITQALRSLELAELLGQQAPFAVDPASEASTKRAFQTYGVSEVTKWTPAAVARLKASLAYFLHHPGILRAKVLPSLQSLSIYEPPDEHQFYIWLWECLFPNDDFAQVPIAGLVEDNDPLECNSLRRPGS